MVHDLPHLVVESWFGLEFGFWGLIAAGAFEQEIAAYHARDPRLVKDGRHGVMMGLARQSPVSGATQDPLVAQHEDELIAAKALTNAFRRWSDGTDEDIEALLNAVDATTREWNAIAQGGKMQLRWPMTRA